MTTYAVWQATVTDTSGNIAAGAEVTVRSESTGLVAAIFEARTGTAKANPFTTGADGFAKFYAAQGLYRIEAEYGGNFIEWRNVRLVEVATSAEALAGTEGVLPDAEQVRKNHVAHVAKITDLRNLEPAFDGQQVELLGHTIAGVGGGIFYADYSSSAADDNGVTIVTSGGRRWARRLDGFVTPEMFGYPADYGTGNTDVTDFVLPAIAAANKVVFSEGITYYFASGNNVDIEKSGMSFFIDGELVKDGTGAIFRIGQTGSFEDIKFSGSGVIRNPTETHPSETTGFLVGSAGNSLDNVRFDGLNVRLSKYGIVSGGFDAELTNIKVTNCDIVINVNGWGSGSTIAQPFDFNLPTATLPSGVITGNHFELINTVSKKGDAFKWTNGRIQFSDNDCIVNGQGQTVSVFSSMNGSKINANSRVINGSGTIEDAIQFNNSTDTEISAFAIVGALAGGGVQLSNCTNCNMSFVSNNTIRQTNGGFMTDCTLHNFKATQFLQTGATSTWTGGKIYDGALSGQCFIKADHADIYNITADMGGLSTRAFYVRGSGNRLKNNVGIYSTATYAIQIEGDGNEIIGTTLQNCTGAWQVVSGDGNRIGRICFKDNTHANYANFLNSGTNTAYHRINIGGLTGTTTIAVPNNPDGETDLEVTFLNGDTNVKNLTGAKDKDRVSIYIMGASHRLTVDRTNAKLAGGADFVGNQYDSLTLIYDESSELWIEISRSLNS